MFSRLAASPGLKLRSLAYGASRKVREGQQGSDSELLVEENMKCLKCKNGSPEALTDLPGWR